MAPNPASPPTPWYDWLLRPWTLDPRSLAAMRIGIGLVLLWDLGNRVVHLSAMYTDDGVVPVEVSRNFYGFPWGFTPFLWSGEWWLAALLFGLMFVASLCLLAGVYTRWTSAFLWLMVGSLHARLPLVNSGGDELLRMFLFWGMFSPWGETWSLDAHRARSSFQGHEPRRDFGTAAIVFQLCVMYGMTAIFKTNDDWYRGEPLLIALRTEQWGTPLGEWLLAWPQLVRSMSWMTLAVEGAIPFLVLSPWGMTPLRLIACALFIGLHVGIELTLDVGQFSAVCISGWLAILPAIVWEVGPGRAVASWMDAWTGTTPAADEPGAQPTTEKTPPHELSRWEYSCQVAGAVFCAFCFSYIVLWQLATVPPMEWYAFDPDRPEDATVVPKAMPSNPFNPLMPAWLRPVGDFFGMNQTWAMFAKAPRMTLWFAAEGRQADGQEVDLLRGGAPLDLGQKPPNSATPFPNHRWQKMYRSLLTRSGSVFAPSVADYLLRSANRERSGEQKLTRVRIITVFEEAKLQKSGEVTEYASQPLATAPPVKGGAFMQQLELEGP